VEASDGRLILLLGSSSCAQRACDSQVAAVTGGKAGRAVRLLNTGGRTQMGQIFMGYVEY
jgi:hypothetical protein